MIQKWTKEEIKFLKDNYKKGDSFISQALNRSCVSVNNKIRLLKSWGEIPYVTKNHPDIINKYGKETIDFILKNYPIYGSRYCLEKIQNLTPNKLFNICATLNIMRKIPKKRVERLFDFIQFKKMSSLSCYLLGFIWGDGHVCSDQPLITLNNIKSDFANIVPYFLKYGNCYFKDLKRENRQQQLCLVIRDKWFVDFLIKHGYLQKKNQSANPILNIIPENLKRYWWRGFFDADGHFSFEETKQGFCKVCSFSLSSSFEQNWDFVEQLFSDLKIAQFTIYRHEHKNNKGRFSAVRIDTANEIKKFLDFIYVEYDFIGLGRKYLEYIKLNEYLEYKKQNPYFFDKIKDK